MDQQLYELPNGWDWKCFSEVCDNITDGAHASPKTVEEGKPYVTVRDVNAQGEIDLITCKKISDKDFESLTKANCSPFSGDVLLSKDGTVGKVALVKENYIQFVVLSSLAIIRPNKNILNSEFLKNFLLSPSFQEYAINSKTGAAIKRIVLRNIKSFQIPLPPLSEQKRIVEKLDSLLSRIDQAIYHLQESLGLAEALFTSSLDGAFNPLGSAKNAEGVYELPDGWEWKTVDEVSLQLQTGTTPPTNNEEYYSVPEINWYAPSDFDGSQYLGEPKKKVSSKAVEDGKVKLFKPNTLLLIAIGGTIGKVALVKGEASSNQQITGITFTDNINPIWSYYWFTHTKKNIISRASQATLPIINQKGIKDLLFPFPTLSEQKRIVGKLDHLSIQKKELKGKLQGQIDDLNALKASLLDAAFRGEL